MHGDKGGVHIHEEGASGLDVGTLNQLRNVVNISKDPSSNVNASEDFRRLLHQHILWQQQWKF